MTAWVLHVDMDQFVAAVELLRRPELIGKPVIVGGRGDPAERAVVSTASYEAREFGVRSGMPLKSAVKRCPDAVFLPVDFPACEAASATVMATLRAFPGATVQLLGWDEAFVGIETADPEGTARDIQAAVLTATDLHCSVGIGDTTVRAKNATDFGKPRGIFTLTKDTWLDVLGDKPTRDLWGIGKRISERLSSLGIQTVRDLAFADDDSVAAEFGPNTGPHIKALGRGTGPTQADDTPWVPRAHGHETTYQQNLTTHDQIRDALASLSAQVVEDLRREERACQRVHLKVRFAPFFTVTRVRKLAEPTFDVEVITDTAEALFRQLADGRPVRLLGVRGEMVPPEGGYG